MYIYTWNCWLKSWKTEFIASKILYFHKIIEEETVKFQNIQLHKMILKTSAELTILLRSASVRRLSWKLGESVLVLSMQWRARLLEAKELSLVKLEISYKFYVLIYLYLRLPWSLVSKAVGLACSNTEFDYFISKV